MSLVYAGYTRQEWGRLEMTGGVSVVTRCCVFLKGSKRGQVKSVLS